MVGSEELGMTLLGMVGMGCTWHGVFLQGCTISSWSVVVFYITQYWPRVYMVWLTGMWLHVAVWAVRGYGGSAPTHVAVHSLAVSGLGSALPQKRQAGTPPVQNNTLGTAPLYVSLGAAPRRWLCLVGAAWGPWEDRMAFPELQFPSSPALQIPPLLIPV